MSLSHTPGQAQVEFSEGLGVIGGVECKRHYFAMALPHSEIILIKVYSTETAQTFCDRHNAAFCVLRPRTGFGALRQYHHRDGEDLR